MEALPPPDQAEALMALCEYWTRLEEEALRAYNYATIQRKLFTTRYEALAAGTELDVVERRLTLIRGGLDAS